MTAFTARPCLRAALVASLATLAMGAAQAQNYAPSTAGASIGSTDYGTGLKVYVGGKITPIFGWEGQLLSFGSEDYAPGRERSAMAIGASGTARFMLAPTLAVFGKAGLHHVRAKNTGYGTDSGLELGVGAGLLWHFTQTAALRLEYENIGGGDGDMASIGLQFSF